MSCGNRGHTHKACVGDLCHLSAVRVLENCAERCLTLRTRLYVPRRLFSSYKFLLTEASSPFLGFIPALPFCQISLKAPKPQPSQYPKSLNTLGDHIRKKRLDLGLLQKDVATQIGVAEATIYNWETQRTAPTLYSIPKVLKFLGYVPLNTDSQDLGQKLRTFRRLRGLTQKTLARRLGVDPTTLARWESEKSRPSGKLMGRIRLLLAGS